VSGGELWRVAEHPETSLREVLADLRPNLAAREAFAEAFGVEALEDLPAAPVTARWREEHLLVPGVESGAGADRGRLKGRIKDGPRG
jgi:hypothetical protein